MYLVCIYLGYQLAGGTSQLAMLQGYAIAGTPLDTDTRSTRGIRVAETMGFEPMIPVSRYAHLANECLQPLGHVSVTGCMPPVC